MAAHSKSFREKFFAEFDKIRTVKGTARKMKISPATAKRWVRERAAAAAKPSPTPPKDVTSLSVTSVKAAEGAKSAAKKPAKKKSTAKKSAAKPVVRAKKAPKAKAAKLTPKAAKAKPKASKPTMAEKVIANAKFGRIGSPLSTPTVDDIIKSPATLENLAAKLDFMEARLEVALYDLGAAQNEISDTYNALIAVRGARPRTVHYSVGVGYYTAEDHRIAQEE